MLDILMLALALSVDAFVVSFSYGLIIKKGKGRSALKLSIATGLGQFIMPVLGWYGAKQIYNTISSIDHWIAFFVFVILGIKIIADSRHCECKEKSPAPHLSLKVLFFIAIATSIDALVSGSVLYFMNISVWVAAPTIGLTTFVLSFIGFNFCRIFKKIKTTYLEIFSGIILILLGFKVLIEHLS